MQRILRAVLAVSLVVSGSALATGSGKTGYSGKGGSTCNACHSGGATPTVAMDGPTTLAAGAEGTYTFTISGGAGIVGGFNVATSRSTANLVPGTGQKKTGAELTQSTPKAFSSGEVSFTFTMTAPPEGGGMVTIYAAGNSTNDNNGDSGDKAAALTWDVTIEDAVDPVDAGMTETDAGMMENDAGTQDTDAGSDNGSDDAGTGNGPGAGDGTPPPAEEEPTGGCAGAGMALAPMVLGAWVLHLRRRSRRQV